MKQRLDQLLVQRGLYESRSQAESDIRLGKVSVGGRPITKPGYFVHVDADINIPATERYVSRAGNKLASVADALGIIFSGKLVLDVGSSTGGFTDYALKHGARKVYAVDVGTDQLHPSLRSDERIDLHEKTDIRNFTPAEVPDIVVMDVSFISVRQVLPQVADMLRPGGELVIMVKPQFEAGKHQVNKGVIKNDTVRRQILKDFELWTKELFIIVDKADSAVAGARGNRERFYLLKKSA